MSTKTEHITNDQANNIIGAMLALRDVLAEGYNLRIKLVMGGSELMRMSCDEDDLDEYDEDDRMASMSASADDRETLRKSAETAAKARKPAPKKRGRPPGKKRAK